MILVSNFPRTIITKKLLYKKLEESLDTGKMTSHVAQVDENRSFGIDHVFTHISG